MSDGLVRLSKEQLKQILERGYTHAMVNNQVVRVTKKDLVFKKDEVEEWLKNSKKDKEESA